MSLSDILSQNHFFSHTYQLFQKRDLDRCHDIVERCLTGVCYSFFKGWLFFLRQDVFSSVKEFQSIKEVSYQEIFLFLQKELKSSNEEGVFIHLIDIFSSYIGDDPLWDTLRSSSYLHLGLEEKALFVIYRAIKKFPDSIIVKNTYIFILNNLGDYKKSIYLLNKMNISSSNKWFILNNLGYLLNSIGNLDESIMAYRKAISLQPLDPQLRLNYSISLLKNKNFFQGWQEHEWRFKTPHHNILPIEKLLPNIYPNTNLTNKNIILTQEEGIGDTIMYLRYLYLLKEYKCNVFIICRKELSPLLEKISFLKVVKDINEISHYDYHCPFISLPRVFHHIKSTISQIPLPCLEIPACKEKLWHKRILEHSPSRKLRVGLAWSGSNHNSDRHIRLLNRQRSIDISYFNILRSFHEEIDFYSLQKDTNYSDIKRSYLNIINLMNECHNMEDTAALIKNIDIVITVDTSIVHLSGSLKKETLLLNRYNGCWRWGHKDVRSEWYPHVKIFNQSIFNDWTMPMKDIHSYLEKVIKNKCKYIPDD